jgi:phosphatidylglycerophosphate synthase
MTQQTKNILYPASSILILVAAVIYYFFPHIAGYILLAGVAGVALVTFTSPYEGESLRGKRLFNIQIVAVILMFISAYLMYEQMSQWVITLLLSAIFTFYSTVMMAKELEKEKNND